MHALALLLITPPSVTNYYLNCMLLDKTLFDESYSEGYTPIHHSNTIVKFTDDTMVVELVFGSVVQRTCFLNKQRQKSSLCLLDFRKNEKVTHTLLINRDLESVSDFCGLTH